MRQFIAIQPSPDFLSALSVLQERLRSAGVTARYLEPANLHMTLAFIGEWPETPVQLLPPVRQSFPITLSHLGIFQEADVLWAGVEPSDALNDLAERVRKALAEVEIPFDRKPFVPHITLGRKPRAPVPLSGIEVPKAAMTVDDVCLYRSEHGPVYTVIGRASENAGKT